MDFKSQPSGTDPYSFETGVTRYANFPKISVTIFYLGAYFDQQYVEFQKDESDTIPTNLFLSTLITLQQIHK